MQRQKSFAYSLKLCVCKPFSFHDGTMKMIVDIGKGTKLQLCCTNPRIGNRRFSLKFCTVRDVYGHFHIPTQINDYIGPSGREKCLPTNSFQRVCEAFLAPHLTQQQQRSTPPETTCPLRDLVHGWPISAFILTSVLVKSCNV